MGGIFPSHGKKPEEPEPDDKGKTLFLTPEFFQGTMLTLETLDKMGGPLAALGYYLKNDVTTMRIPLEEAEKLGIQSAYRKRAYVEILMSDHPHYLPTIQRLAQLLADKALIEGGEENLLAYEEAKRLLAGEGYDAEGNPVREDRTPTPIPEPGSVAAAVEISSTKVARVQLVGIGDAKTLSFKISEGKWEEIFKKEEVYLFFHDGFVFLKDGRRRSETGINDEQIPPHMQVPLAEGDRVQIGDQEFVISDSHTLARIEDLELDEVRVSDTDILGVVNRMRTMPKWRQRVIGAQIMAAKNESELMTALSRAAEYGSILIMNQVAWVLRRRPGSSLEDLPNIWEIRKKVLELMGEPDAP